MGLGEVALQAGTQIRSPCGLKPTGLRSGRESKANSQADSSGGSRPKSVALSRIGEEGPEGENPACTEGAVWAQPPGLHLNKPAALGKRGPCSHRPAQWTWPRPSGEVSLLQQVGPTPGLQQREVRLAH